MKRIFLFLILISFNLFVIGQDLNKSDSLAIIIPDSITNNAYSFAKYLKNNLKTDDKIVRALYVWLGTNITYDLDQLDSIEMLVVKNNYEGFTAYTLKNKKGVCTNYASVFNTICKLNGIKSYIVTGYTKQFGEIDLKISHAWNVAKIENKWYLFDPTWGAGFIRFERFHKKFTFNYYKINPDTLIKSHIPFDPIWQLKDYPLSHKDFLTNSFNQNTQIDFNDSIEKYLSLSEINKIKTAFERSKQYGLDQPLLNKYYNRNKDYYKKYTQWYYIEQYNLAVNELNEAISIYNKYIKNNRNKSQNSKINEIILKINISKEFLRNTSSEAIDQLKIDKLNTNILNFEKFILSLKSKQPKK